MPINGRPYPLRNSTIGILPINNFRRSPKSSALATVDSGQAFEARVLKLLQCLILDDVRRHAKPLPVSVSFILPIHNLNSVMVVDVFVNSGRGMVTPKLPENRYVLKQISYGTLLVTILASHRALLVENMASNTSSCKSI